MFGALLSFLGGSAFRLLWGDISGWISARQNHAHEMAMATLQAKFEAEAFTRQQEAIKAQHDMKVEVIRVQGEIDLDKLDGQIFGKGVDATMSQTGIWIVDFLNGMIRPLLAIECMALWSFHLYNSGWKLDDNGWSLVGAALGIFVADRSLMKRGK